MCGICTLPTTHVNTLSAVSVVSLFLMLLWTFIWAWWVITKIRVENYFVDTVHSIKSARQVGYGKTLLRLLLTNKKYQMVVVLVFVSVGMLVWAQLESQKKANLVEPVYTDQYIAVPMINIDREEILQLKKI